jgi:hypothetical protein
MNEAARLFAKPRDDREPCFPRSENADPGQPALFFQP